MNVKKACLFLVLAFVVVGIAVAQIKHPAVDSARNSGYSDGFYNKSKQNPYSYENNADLFWAWNEGYNLGQVDNREGKRYGSSLSNDNSSWGLRGLDSPISEQGQENTIGERYQEPGTRMGGTIYFQF